VDNQRNMIMAIVLSALVLFGWSAASERFFPAPKAPVQTTAPATPGAAPAVPGSAPIAGAATVAAAPAIKPLGTALAQGGRVAIETPSLKGSIALTGARIDDLVLVRHTETIKKDSPLIRLLSPEGTKRSYYAGFGWTGTGFKAPDATTVWTADGTKLTPKTPVTLRWDNGTGQLFAIKLAVDNDYLFTATQTITNAAAAPVEARAFGLVNRSYGTSTDASMIAQRHDVDSWTMHVGPIGDFNDAVNFDVDYENLGGAEPGFLSKLFGNNTKAGSNVFTSKGGWLGFGDTYWLTALVPAQGSSVESGFYPVSGQYRAEVANPVTIIGAGKSLTNTTRLFAGAKEVALLDRYADEGGIARLGKSIDWGWFEIIEKPMFKLLSFLFKIAGNFGVAIILLTVIVRGLMFPIAQRQFASMASMRAVQPKMKALQEKHKDDKPKLQQEMMEMYKREKINPAAGCLPIFLQIPIFYALYKCLLVTIEMRHQPFALWVNDLSAPDPFMFGLFPNLPIPGFLAIGILPILLGITMYLQFKLNPAPADPVQQQVFSIMPWIMMFMMAPFAAGLQLYWVVSNTLTILQQKWLYSKHPGLKEPVKK
jgi:YidC/Oxa1 family membrane protein insertase